MPRPARARQPRRCRANSTHPPLPCPRQPALHRWWWMTLVAANDPDAGQRAHIYTAAFAGICGKYDHSLSWSTCRSGRSRPNAADDWEVLRRCTPPLIGWCLPPPPRLKHPFHSKVGEHSTQQIVGAVYGAGRDPREHHTQAGAGPHRCAGGAGMHLLIPSPLSCLLSC